MSDPTTDTPTTEKTELTLKQDTHFEILQRQATALASSDKVPTEYRKNVANCMIALDMANRTGSAPIAIMQSLYVVQGKPTFSGQFIIGIINACGKFSPLRYDEGGEGEQKYCIAYATDTDTGDRLDGIKVTMAMATAEGWSTKKGSKWQTMPDLMLRYRAATFFGRTYCPERLLGMQSTEEVIDVTPDTPQNIKTVVEVNADLELGDAIDSTATALPAEQPANTSSEEL